MPRFFKSIFPLLLSLAAVSDLQATTYYVSVTSGSDSNNGTSLATPFQTIQKAANVMLSSGDVCNIRTGLYRETVTVKASNVTFQAYNPTPATPSTAEPVTITGTELIPAANWTVDSTGTSGTTWSVAVPSGNGTVTVDQTQVFQGTLQTSGSQTGMVMQPEACWPNAGPTYPWHDSTLAHPSPYNQVGDWSYVDTSVSSSGYDTFTDAQLPSSYSSFLAGAMINIMPYQGWTLAFPTPTVTSFNGTTVVTTNLTSSYTIIPGNEYYVFGKKELMDSQGEWFCAGSGTTPATLYYLGNSTQPQNIEVKRRLYGFDLSGRSSITLTSLNFFGCTINTDASSTSCTFNWLMMKYLQHNRQVYNGNVYSITLYNNSVMRNCELAWASTSMLYIAGSNIKVINNYLHDSGYVPQGVAMVGISGSANLISHNTFQNSGHAIMGGVSISSVIEYNNMYNAMKICSDGGVFYSSGVGGNTVVRYNLLHDSPGPAGHPGNGVAGFYLDNENSNWIVHHNIIWNLTGQQSHAIQINGRTNTNLIFNNTCWNCYSGSIYTAAYTDGPTGTKIYNNIFQGGPTGVQGTWNQTDLNYNYNLSTDPGFVSASAGNFQLSSTATNVINKGTPVTGVTDVAPMISSTTPDIGALQYGGTNWTATSGSNCVGYNFISPPSPDPVITLPFIPYENVVQDPSFESGSLASYTTSGNLGLIRSDAWNDSHLRSGLFGVQIAGGNSQISQAVTNLQPNSRYVFQCGVLKSDTTAIVTLGVSCVPYPNWEVTVLPSGTATGVWVNALPPVPTMYAMSFSTGLSSTQATVYVKVTRDTGVQVVSAIAPNLSLTATAAALTSLSNGTNNWNYFGNAYPTTGVYIDDLSVTLSSTAPTPILSVTPSSAFASAGQVGGPFTVTTGTFSVANIGNVPISWAVSNTSSWLTVSSTGGTLLAAGSTTVTATIVAGATGFASGTYRDTLAFTNTYNGAGNISIPCTLNISVPAPVMSVTPATSLAATGPAGGPFTPSSTSYTVTNTGNLPMNWTVSNTSSWLTVSSSGGTLAAHGSTIVTATTTSSAYGLTSGTYSDSLVFTNTSNGYGNTSLACTLTIGNDYFTQLFATGSNNTAYHSFTFTPNGSGYSPVNCDATTAFPTNPSGGSILSEGDDTSVAVTLTGTASVQLYGINYTTFYVGSNGYITFGSGDTSYHSLLTTHFSLPRISGLFRDLNPSASGTISWIQLTDRVAVTYQNVPAYSTTNSNNFQIEMFFDGRIRITVLSIQSLDGIIGLSQGLGAPSDFTNSIFLTYPATPLSLAVTTPDYTTTTSPTISLQGSASGANGISSVVANGTTATTSDSFAHWTVPLGLSLGTNTITITATNGVVPANTISATRRVLYYTSTSSSFGNGLPDAWKIAHGLDPFSNTGVNSAIGNPSGDGISNLMKYALNLDPQLKQAGKLPYTTKAVNIADSKTYLIFNYRRIIGGGGLTYIVETSTNLTGWSSTNSDLEEISATPDADGVTQDVQVRLHPAISTLPAGSKFIRLRVTTP